MSNELVKAFNSSAVETLGAFAESNVELSESHPYLSFVSPKSPKYPDILEQLGKIDDGTPFVFADGRYVAVSEASIISIREIAYWATLTKDFRVDKATTEKQSFGARREGERVKEHILSVLLVLHPELPSGIALTLTTFRSTKTPALRAFLRGMRDASQPGWAKISKQNAAVMSAPPRFRTAAVIRMKRMPGSSFPYDKATGIARTVTAAQQSVLARWLNDADQKAALGDVLEAYARQEQDLAKMTEEY